MSADGQRLSPLQEHLFRLQESWPATPWSARIAVRIGGTLDPEALRAALAGAVARHEILRTRFARPAPEDAPLQVVEPEGRASLQLLDLRSASENERARQLLDLKQALSAPQALDEPAALRAALVVLGENEQRLCLVQSPLAADWRSLWNLTRELARALAGEPEGAEPMQFVDLARWLRDAREGEDARTGTELWRRVARAAASALRLPLEYEREPRPLDPGELVLPLPAGTKVALEQLARSCSVPLASLLLAAWQVLLARSSERDELVMGVRSSGRAFHGLEGALGTFERLLPVAAHIEERTTIARLARRADEGMAQAEEWHEYFDPEGLGGVPVHHLFEFLPSVEPFECGGRRFELVRRESLSEPLRCSLRVEEHPGGFELRLAHDPRFLSRADAEALAEQYLALLADCCARPEVPVRTLSLLSSGMRERILERFGAGPALAPESRCIHGWILETAREHPHAVAVTARGPALTYRELEERSGRLAAHLQRLGIGPGEFVGLHLERSVELVVAVLAVLRAGGAYLPLPPAYPRERIRFMLEDSRAKVVLCATGAVATLAGFDGRIVPLGARVLETLPDERPAERSRPSDVAYAIYTSGSTGTPKGVPVTHANLVHSTRARAAHYPEPVGTYLLLSPLAFDSSVAGIFWTLAQGGNLVLPPEDLEQDLTALPGLIARHRVTHLLALPSLWSLVLEHARAGELDSLRTVIVAGESCPPELVPGHARRLPRAHLYNEYGPTECSVWSTVFDCAGTLARPQVPIGRPIPGIRVHVVCEDGTLAPIGISGELWIGGPSVSEGYLRRPDLTRERFGPDPFVPGRVYRTGDRARWLPDGNLEFLGRLDHQVKIAGFRIELEEIEAALRSHPSVREALVLVRNDEGRGTRLVAYVTAGERRPVQVELLRHLSERLPAHMVPANAVVLEQWPRLPDGKIDRAALRPPSEKEGSEEPVGALETVLAALFADVLGLERVGRQDDFFALGGHSLLATRLYARLREALQAPLSLRALFEHRTPAALAEELVRAPEDRARVERLAALVLSVLELSDEESRRALGA